MDLSPQHSLLIFDAVSFQKTSIKDKIKLIKSILNCEEEQKTEIISKIREYIDTTKVSLNYFYMLLIYYMLIRPKNRKTYYTLIHSINQIDDNKKCFIRHLSAKWGDLSCKFISPQIEQLFLNKQKIDDSAFSIYNDDNFKNILLNDDIDELTNIISMQVDFYYNKKIPTDPQLDWVKSQSFQSLLSICALYGSTQCFKYFISNGTDISEDICLFAVAGGNSEIIHILQQKEQKFNNASFETAIKFHRNDIADWIIFHYDLFNVSLN